MKLQARDRRALWILAIAAAVSLAAYFFPESGAQTQVIQASDSIPLAEKRLARLRQIVASVPGKQKELEHYSALLKEREQGLLQADTAAQAQALLLQILRRVGRNQGPPIEIRSVELGRVEPLGKDYGEAQVSVSFDCRIEQLLNLLADLTSQPELLATEEIRIGAGDTKQKMLAVRLTVSGVVPRRLVPEKKGLVTF